MTVRRDLDELDKEGLLIRIHGGAQSIDTPKVKPKYEKSNSEKQELQIEENALLQNLQVNSSKMAKQFSSVLEQHLNILHMSLSLKISVS